MSYLISDLIESVRGVGDELSEEDLLVGVEGVDDERQQLVDVALEGCAGRAAGWRRGVVGGEVLQREAAPRSKSSSPRGPAKATPGGRAP